MTQRIVVFTRFPEPGKTKTRLIPAMGAEGAAQLQMEMTRHVLATVLAFAARFDGSVEVRFEGGDVRRMQARFGNGVAYRPQGEGDLGARLERAVAAAFDEDAQKLLVLGADCPDITPELIAEAFDHLSSTDVVLGPARDGGYYLIGLRVPAYQLFRDIPWGGAEVLEQTLHRASQLSLTVSLLKVLSDVDRPEDLAVWQRARHDQGKNPAVATISIVIPTLNEANSLQRTLRSVQHGEEVETIVVDGGSVDTTQAIAERQGCRVLRSPPSRAAQLNTGGEAASGTFLLFLHADTRLSPGFDTAVRSTLRDSHVVAGAFRLCIDAPGPSIRAIEQTVAIRSKFFQMPYGDQAIFVRKETFQQVGGFPSIPIMDDYEFVRRLRRLGRIRMVDLAAVTSGRRWQRLGPWRTTWINQKIILGYHLGVSPERLAIWYRQVSK